MILIYLMYAFGLVFGVMGFVALFSGPGGKGVPFVPSDRKRIAAMLQLAGDLKGKRVIDMGSGDGRVVIAFARAGAHVDGFEINPVLALWSYLWLFLRSLHAHIYMKSYWHADLSQYDIVVIFGLPPMMPALEQKLMHELRPDAIVLSNSFKLPTWPIAQSAEGVHLYRRSDLTA